MRLKLYLPDRLLLERKVLKLIAEGREGHFCLEPHHVDYISAIVPGILTYLDQTGREGYLAVDEGVLVKRGEEVRIAAFKAFEGERLETLKFKVKEEILKLSEAEQAVRKTLARLEAGLLRRYRELERLKR